MIQLVGRDIAIEIEEEEDDAPPSDRNADKEELAARDLGMSEICPKRTEAAAVLLLGWRLRATQASSETAPRFRKYESCSGERVR